MKTQNNKIDIYGVDLYIVYSESEYKKLTTKINNQLKDTQTLNYPSNTVAATGYFLPSDAMGSPVVIFAVNMGTFTRLQLVNISAHEATHAAGFILEGIDAEYNGDSEPFAYLVAWLTAWLYEQISQKVEVHD